MADTRGVPVLEHLAALLVEMDKRYQQRSDDQTTAINAALLAAEKAVTKAETATERRFEGVNEFRATLSDQAATFISRVEFEAISERLRELAARLDRFEGRSTGLSAGWGYLIGAVGVLVGLVAVFMTLNA